jgi:hypothetical protein
MVIDRARKLAGLPPLDQVGKSIWHCVKFKYGYHNIDNDCDPMMAVVEITEDLAAMGAGSPEAGQRALTPSQPRLRHLSTKPGIGTTEPTPGC